jgi:hypothetical protein
MLRNHGWLALVTLAAIGITGCGKSDGPAQQSATSSDNNTQATASNTSGVQKVDTPEAACTQFLEALRTGNDEKASQMLSAASREKANSLNRSVTPSASDTARFIIDKNVKYIGEDGAQVKSTWTDVDDEGKPQSDDAVWVLRHEKEGWRIVGVAWIIFPGEPPLVLNFEDPEEMLKKQQWAREELRRRAEKENLQAKEPESTENSMRR